MNCTRCKKDFITEHLSFFKWVATACRAAAQTAFAMRSYGRQLCNECREATEESFCAGRIHPCFNPK